MCKLVKNNWHFYHLNILTGSKYVQQNVLLWPLHKHCPTTSRTMREAFGTTDLGTYLEAVINPLNYLK